MRAVFIHAMTDAAVSVLVIAGLLLARIFSWLWMDAVAGILGAIVIANWSYGLVRDTGAILLDIAPDRRLAESVHGAVEDEGGQPADPHVWRLGPGHLGAIVSVMTARDHGAAFYHARLARFQALLHVTVEDGCLSVSLSVSDHLCQASLDLPIAGSSRVPAAVTARRQRCRP